MSHIENKSEEVPQAISENATPATSKSASHWWLTCLTLAVVVLASVIYSGIHERAHAETALGISTERAAVPAVNVVHPVPGAASQEIVLPGNTEPFNDTPIYARTNGYLKRWYVDIGAHVQQGQLLAEIDTPEVDQQLDQARADLKAAQANEQLAQITAARWQNLLKTNSVSKQETDQAVSDLSARHATVDSMAANVKRLEQLVSFEKIYAPFTGVITARNTDIGALIDSGSSGGARTELFHIAQPDRLRVYVNVPQVYSQAAKPGLTADLVLSEFPGRRFSGTLVRTANAIDQNTRTLLVEIAVNNPTGILFSGAYAELHLKLPGAASSFTLPVTTLLFRSEGLRVVTVKDGQHAELTPITLGRDYGSEVEVVAGLTGNESVNTNPPDSIVSGEEVRVAQTPSATPAAGGSKQ